MTVAIKKLNSTDLGFAEDLLELLNRDQSTSSDVEAIVADVIRDVAANGDNALFRYTQQFDGFDVEARGLEVRPSRIQQAYDSISVAQRDALEYAAERVRAYHKNQLQESWSYTEADGTQLGQKVTPMKRVGLYVPGGKATYPSSVIMNAIPAKVAGVKELIMVSPTPKGEFNDMVLAAAKIAGVDRVFRVGGAQAVAALAYGTDTIPEVDKITGPGNIFVATAKKQVFGKVGIDMIAGPSEVLVIADDSVNPDWVAMDLFAQAEHDEIAQSILLTTSDDVAEAVRSSIEALLPTMERADIIAQSLANNGALIVVESDDELIQIADQIAAEHLEIFTENSDELAEKITNAGAIFIGPYSAESLGDYCAGPNHVLPTAGTARFTAGLNVFTFLRIRTWLKLDQAPEELVADTARLAEIEGLIGHQRSGLKRGSSSTS